jgi:hypothetical protein
MSQDFFEGFKEGMVLGSRHKYLQIHLLTLIKDFEKINQKSKQNHAYELWTKVIDTFTNIEELCLYTEDEIDNRKEALQELCSTFNHLRKQYKVLLEHYYELKKTKPVKRKRKASKPRVVADDIVPDV